MSVAARKPFSVGLVALCVVVGALACTTAPALAAAPEIPTLTVEEPVRPPDVTLRGVLNPGKEGEPGTYEMDEYEFVYKASETKVCEGGGTEPVPAGLSLGGGKEEIAQSLEGLTQDTEYAVCLVVHNAAKTEEVVSPAVTFKTGTPEPPANLEAESVTARTATLTGVLNPNHAGEKGAYEFVYKQSEGECTGENEKTVAGAAVATREPVEAKITELLPNMPYTFCLRAKNEAGEEALSAPVTFTTLAAAPTIAGESVSLVEATEATLEAEVVPDGAATTAHFEYLTEAQFDANGETFTGAETTAGSKSIGADDATHAVPGVRVPEAGHPALLPNTAYRYRVVATNEVGGKVETAAGPGKTFTTPPAPGSETSQNCTNEQLRAEQPFGLTLPDCRAYEMVSPVETNGQDAAEQFVESGARAAVSGEAVTYASEGSFAGPTGATIQNQYLSSRNAKNGRWETQSITPPHDPVELEKRAPYRGMDFTPDLSEGIANTNASLVGDEPGEKNASEFGVYLADFANGSYRYVGASSEEIAFPLGASTDLSHVVDAEDGVSEWVNGKVVPVGVSNGGEGLGASVGTTASFYSFDKEVWHAVSADGSRVYLTTPASVEEEGSRRLYVRVNAENPLQSPLATPEANATGSLAAGSETVTALAPIFAAESYASLTAGSTEITLNLEGSRGSFYVGQPVSVSGSQPGIPAGTTIAKISGSAPTLSVTLSAPAEISGTVVIEAERPESFAVGQQISGYGIPPGTTVAATDVSGSTLTLSAPAAVNGSAIALNAGGECTDPTEDACTIEVSAPQRTTPDTAGPQSARYWGASADGSKVFFTSNAELTNDAYTGSKDAAANLYEYELSDEGKPGRLTDLTGEKTDKTGEGAAVQGVVQISEEGQYVYFVANGALAAGASEQQCREETENERTGAETKQDNLGCNLYVSHEGGEPAFIATLSWNDRSDWYANTAEYPEEEAGPEINTAVVAPGGKRLAFISEASLTGYDNEQARHGDCEAQVEQSSETGRCREIYLYDAGSGGAGSLVCASCDPSGARPLGPASFGHGQDSYMQYRARNLLEDGTLFFDSSDALVPNANDGRQNVYEYEGAHVYAISNVAGGDESFFMDASDKPGEEGTNVFFGSADQLLPEDTGNSVVVYDARVGGGFPVTAAPPWCDNGDSCKPPSSPQPSVFAPTGSATFSGPGNSTPTITTTVTPKQKTAAQLKAEKLAKALRQCAKDRKKSKRAKCQKQARQKYGASKAKKSAHVNQRAPR